MPAGPTDGPSGGGYPENNSAERPMTQFDPVALETCVAIFASAVIRQGKLIKAIKHTRQSLGVGLAYLLLR
jgi:hypothetical protein